MKTDTLFYQVFQNELPNDDWYGIVIYRRRSLETPAPKRYRDLIEQRVQRIDWDEIQTAGE